MKIQTFGGCPTCGVQACVGRACSLGQFFPGRKDKIDSPPTNSRQLLANHECSLYTKVVNVAWRQGYTIYIQMDSLSSLSLVAIPWEENACDPFQLMSIIKEVTMFTASDASPEREPQGRLTWNLFSTSEGERQSLVVSVVSRPN